MSDKKVLPWPKAGGIAAPLPQPIRRPCDAGLWLAVRHLETQLGTVEAYNRLVRAAEELHAKIANGKAEAQNPLYAKNPRG
jgi:hypothetical protein